MKPFTRLFTYSLFSLLLSIPAAAFAAPPANSPYMTDPQSTYVQDETSTGVNNLNMVLCIVHAMDPADMVNQGAYIALVDMNKCDSSSQASASNSTGGASGATSAPNYMKAIAVITRASNTAPMIGKVWMTMTQHGMQINVYAHLTATQSPTAAPPYGQLRVDYISKLPNGGTAPGGGTLAAGAMGFNGFVDTNGAAVSYFETGPISNGTALAMTATSTTAGSGTMTVPNTSGSGTQTFNFAYDGSEANFPKGVFRRFNGTTDACFDRAQANAQKSVWNYGTYNATDGTRVDVANPGFPITASTGGNTYYGYAGYWGINFQGFDLNSVADGLVANTTINDQRPNNTNTYSLHKVSGKLTKWAKNATTLADMDGVPFSAWIDLTSLGGSFGPGNWELHWDNAAGNFVVTGQQTCGNNGCVITSLSAATTIPAGTFATTPIEGWSDSFGGNIDIPFTSANHAGSDAVNYYSQSQVIPGSAGAPTTLYCLSNCPTATTIGAFTGNNSPFDTNTTTQWGMGTTQVTYGFGSTGLTQSSTPMTVTNSSLLTGQYQNGIMTGRLYATALTNASCPAGTPGGTVCEPSSPAAYYTWQTGADQWNQSTWLVNTGTSAVVTFDPPANINYTVPAGAAYGTWGGKKIVLQFDGFGNLEGIPGSCVSSLDNSPVSCGNANARYVPAFALPDGSTMTLTTGAGSTPLIVKGLDTEIRLSKIPACTGVALAQPTTAATLPTAANLHDPTSASDPDYIGTAPTVTAPPKVIDGVLQ